MSARARAEAGPDPQQGSASGRGAEATTVVEQPLPDGRPARRSEPSTDLKHVFSELIRFETELWNAIDAKMRELHDLPLTRFEPMQVIAEQGQCRVYDIAAALSITTGGTSKLIDAIEAAGYCRRRPNPEDRRSSLIELTPAGRRVVTKAQATLQDELQRRLGDVLSGQSLERFASAIAKLRRAGLASG